jgi:hypothetical protein
MKYNILLLTLFMIGFASCGEEDFLNEPPLDRITESDVWSDRDLMDTYIFKIYDNMPWDYLQDFGGAGFGAHRDALSDLAMSTYSWTSANNIFRPGNWGTTNNSWPLDWWGYFNLWKINYALENVERLGEDVLTPEERDNRLGELYFMRAYSYFTMARRYGGVPIILEAQDPNTTPEEEYFPIRNTEKEVYDQVFEDTQAAFDLLPDRWTGQKGRAGRWAAKALESRAALYAASIAKYSTVELDGVVGIPSSDADFYYQLSLDASNKIINESGHSLFNGYENPAE